MAASEQKADGAFREYVVQHTQEIISSLPPISKKTRKLSQQLDPKQHSNFIYRLPNPTIATFDPLKLKCRELRPEHFYGIHSLLVIFAPSHYWNGQFQVLCPCCKRPARLHGWTADVRRVCGLLGTFYLVGARYKCEGCPEKQKAMHYKAVLAGEHAFDIPDLPGSDEVQPEQPAASVPQRQQQATTAHQQEGKTKQGRKPKAGQQQQQKNPGAKKQRLEQTRQHHAEAAKSFTFTFSAYDKAVLDMLPAYVQQQVPFLTTAKGAIDVVPLQLLKTLAVSDVGFSNLKLLMV